MSKTQMERIAEAMKIFNDSLTDRELRLIENSVHYAQHSPAGLPGHNLMVIIDKFNDLFTTVGSIVAEGESLCPLKDTGSLNLG